MTYEPELPEAGPSRHPGALQVDVTPVAPVVRLDGTRETTSSEFPQPHTNAVHTHAVDFSLVPELMGRLNMVLSHLRHGAGHDEELPQYEA